jgi:hypothetical protein
VRGFLRSGGQTLAVRVGPSNADPSHDHSETPLCGPVKRRGTGSAYGSGATGTIRSSLSTCWTGWGSPVGGVESAEELFVGRHFNRWVIFLRVRWYLQFKLSLRDLVEMMAERGLSMAHTTIMRWVQRYAPEFEKRWGRFALAVGRLWRLDEVP